MHFSVTEISNFNNPYWGIHIEVTRLDTHPILSFGCKAHRPFPCSHSSCTSQSKLNNLVWWKSILTNLIQQIQSTVQTPNCLACNAIPLNACTMFPCLTQAQITQVYSKLTILYASASSSILLALASLRYSSPTKANTQESVDLSLSVSPFEVIQIPKPILGWSCGWDGCLRQCVWI